MCISCLHYQCSILSPLQYYNLLSMKFQSGQNYHTHKVIVKLIFNNNQMIKKKKKKEKNFMYKTGQICTKEIVKQVLSIFTVMQTVALSNSLTRIVERRNLQCLMHSDSSWSNQGLSLVKHKFAMLKTPTYTIV